MRLFDWSRDWLLDPGAEQYARMASCWGDGHAARLQYLGGAGAGVPGGRSILWQPIRLPWTAGGFVEDHLVGSTGRVPVLQASGAWAICLAVSKGRQGVDVGSATGDVA
jgi:hypothetical protein